MNLTIAFLLMLCGGAFGAWSLRKAWHSRGDEGAGYRYAGWAAILVTLCWPALLLGPARGPFASLAMVSTAALAVVATGATFRTAKAPRAARATADASGSLAPEPLDRQTTGWRTLLRWALAGPIGMIAAMAVGICYAVWVPGEPQTRLLIGGLIVPVAWGGAMAWTLADNRIIRATAVLVGTACTGFGLAILGGFA